MSRINILKGQLLQKEILLTKKIESVSTELIMNAISIMYYMCPSKRKPTLQVKSYYWDN